MLVGAAETIESNAWYIFYIVFSAHCLHRHKKLLQLKSAPLLGQLGCCRVTSSSKSIKRLVNRNESALIREPIRAWAINSIKNTFLSSCPSLAYCYRCWIRLPRPFKLNLNSTHHVSFTAHIFTHNHHRHHAQCDKKSFITMT